MDVKKKLVVLCVLVFVAFSTTACADLMAGLGYGGPDGQGTTGAGGRVEATSYSATEPVTERVTATTVAATTTEATTAAATTEATTVATECDHDGVECSKEVTCTEDGYKGRIVCRLCGMVLNEGSVIGAYGHICKTATYNAKCDKIVWWCEYCDFSQQKDVPALTLTVQAKNGGVWLYVTGGYYPSMVMYAVYKGETTIRFLELEESWSSMDDCNRRCLSFDAERVETVIVYAYDATPYREIVQKFDVIFADGKLSLTVNRDGIERYLSYISK